MSKRKNHKRSRHKQFLYQSQETLLQNSDTSDEIDYVENKYISLQKKSRSSERLLHQRSPESVLFESEQPDLSYYDDLSPEIVPRFRRIKLDLNGSNKHETKEKNNSEKELEVAKVNQVNNLFKQNIDVSAKECFLLDKTLSMNQEIKLEMNNCKFLQEKKSFSRIKFNDYTTTEIRSPKSSYHFPCGYSSEPTKFSNFNSESESHFLDEFQTMISTCDSVGRYEEKWNKHDQDTRVKIINEKIEQDSDGNRSNNWSECRQILSNLRYLSNIKVRTANQEFFGNRVQTNSFSCYTSSSLTSNETSNECINKHYSAEDEKINNKVDDGQNYIDTKSNATRIRARSITPCSGSPPPAKRCRTTLKFDDEVEAEGSKKPVDSATVTDLLQIEKKNVQNYFCPNTTITKTIWSSNSSESPTTLILDLPVMSDSGSCSRCFQEVINFHFNFFNSIDLFKIKIFFSYSNIYIAFIIKNDKSNIIMIKKKRYRT